MYLYLISQTINNGYDTYASAVVAAECAYTAQHIHPDSPRVDLSTWCDPADVVVRCIGKALKNTVSGVICSDFRAG